MYYKELVRVGRGLLVLTVILVVLILVNLAVGGGGHPAVVQVQVNNSPQVATAPADHNDLLPLSLLFAIAGVVATIFAGAYGGSLAAENNGHLDVAWTKPASRSRYALTLFSVDLLGSFAAFALSLATSLVILAIGRYFHYLYVDQDAWRNLARFGLLPFAFFGLWQAITAKLRGQAGNVIGLSVVVSVILLAFGASPLGGAWHAIFKFLNFFNPMAYATYSSGASGIVNPFAGWQLNVAALVAIGVLGIMAALAQWRTVEA